MRKFLTMIGAMFTSTFVMAQDSVQQAIDSLCDTSVSLLDTASVSIADLADKGIADSDFFFPILYVLGVNILAFYSAKIPYLNKISDTETRTLVTGIVLGVAFSLSFPISILQLFLAYAVSTGVVYDWIMKKILKLESVKTA